MSRGFRNGKLVSAFAIASLGGSAVVSTAVSGCGSSGPNETRPKPTAEPVPRSVNEAESDAEDTVDLALAGKRPRVVAKARALRRVAEGAASTSLRRADVPGGRIASFQDRARTVAALAPHAPFVQISLAANQVSALMPELFARYADPVPPAVLKLDYLDREAELRALAGDRAAIQTAVRELSSTWAKLRPRTIDAGGAKVAARYTRHVAAMTRLASGSDGRALHEEAVNGLDLVDLLEGVFRKR